MFTIDVHVMQDHAGGITFAKAWSGEFEPEAALTAYARLVGLRYGSLGVTVHLVQPSRIAVAVGQYMPIDGLERCGQETVGVLYIYTFSCRQASSRVFTAMRVRASTLMRQHDQPVMDERVQAILYGN